jgi:transcriptional regulator with XRE-family HTH domain
MADSTFIQFMRQERLGRKWSLAELARRSSLTTPEVCRLESGQRLPTIRLVKGLAEAFCASPIKAGANFTRYEQWLAHLVDLGERARVDCRVGPGRWGKRCDS